MQNAIAVITARSGSVRVPNKNTLPVGSLNLTQRAIQHAKSAGLKFVLTSDIDEMLAYAESEGGIAVRRPDTLAQGNKHYESIKHAVGQASLVDSGIANLPVVLLQPTSPFREGRIIQRCLEEYARNPFRIVLSGSTLHCSDCYGNSLSTPVWDGCVAVYPPDRVEKPDGATVVHNDHINSLQVDTEDDYAQACVIEWRLDGARYPFHGADRGKCTTLLAPILSGKKVTLVGRPDGCAIDQSNPVVYVNHCRGYDGGRADVLIIVACSNTKRVGINPELREVASKAGVIIVRNFGYADWLVNALGMKEKTTVINMARSSVTTGTVASMLVYAAGGVCERVGFQSNSTRVPYLRKQFGKPRTSDEIAMLTVSGYDRRPQSIDTSQTLDSNT